MKVIAIRNKFVNCPDKIAAFGSPLSESNITVGREYEVFSISIFQSVVCLQIVNDETIISWLPSWFFKVSNGKLPSDWICYLSDGEPEAVLGPEYVARDESSYNRMVELDPESTSAFWDRYDNG